MSKVSRIDDSRLAVEGDMLFADAMTLREQGEALLPAMTSPILVDLSAVGNVGSVGVSVLLCWMRTAEKLGKQLKIVNMADKMYDVSRVSGLDEVLPSR